MASRITASIVWLNLLDFVFKFADEIAPRGQKTLEVRNISYTIDAAAPIIFVPERKLNYRFMAAEPLWIIDGDDKVASIAKFNPKIADYAPLGDRFYGAYGPPFVQQFDYVVNKLLKDKHTRQAVMSFWTPNPPEGVDVACNDLLCFTIRDGQLHLTVSARSKDVWMGLPYDVFTFSMLLTRVLCYYNERASDPVKPGRLTFFDVSLHLYEQHFEAARKILTKYQVAANAFIDCAPQLKLPSTGWFDFRKDLERYANSDKNVVPFTEDLSAQALYDSLGDHW